uniref:WD repeat-containing protein WRAP73 n=1 Tax=Schistocephalus solidus TaxID=70667 RepID=A0A0X3PXJ6_SCHSO
MLGRSFALLIYVASCACLAVWPPSRFQISTTSKSNCDQASWCASPFVNSLPDPSKCRWSSRKNAFCANITMMMMKKKRRRRAGPQLRASWGSCKLSQDFPHLRRGLT